MTDCDDDSATIQLYVDKELSGQELENFHAHLEECETCRTELEAEAELSALLHRSRPLYCAPAALRERVMQVTQAAESSPSTTRYIPVRPRGIATFLSLPFHAAGRRGHNWLPLVAAILLVAASLPLIPRILRQSNANTYIETAIAAHRSFLNGSLPLEIQSDSPSVVAAWFAGKVPFNFRLPRSPEEPGHEQIYRLTGGRLVNYKGGYAALVGYQMLQQKISLLVSSSSSAVAAGGEEVPSGGIVFHYNKQRSFNVITWSNHGLTYALVSSLPGSGRQSCLVCHQDMAEGAHFSARR
jgi:anti-sigma factor (TIGR02949 family)